MASWSNYPWQQVRVFLRGWWIGEAWWEISTGKCVSMVQIQWWLSVDICCKGLRATAGHGSLCLWFTKLIIKHLGTKCIEVWWSQGWYWHWLEDPGLCWIDFLNLDALNPCFWGLEPIRSTNHVLFDFEWCWFPEGTCFALFAHVIHFPGVFASKKNTRGPAVVWMVLWGLPLAVVPPAVRTCGLAIPDCQVPWLVLNIFSAHPSFVYEFYMLYNYI